MTLISLNVMFSICVMSFLVSLGAPITHMMSGLHLGIGVAHVQLKSHDGIVLFWVLLLWMLALISVRHHVCDARLAPCAFHSWIFHS